jgi:hypothetical protein
VFVWGARGCGCGCGWMDGMQRGRFRHYSVWSTSLGAVYRRHVFRHDTGTRRTISLYTRSTCQLEVYFESIERINSYVKGHLVRASECIMLTSCSWIVVTSFNHPTQTAHSNSSGSLLGWLGWLGLAWLGVGQAQQHTNTHTHTNTQTHIDTHTTRDNTTPIVG